DRRIKKSKIATVLQTRLCPVTLFYSQQAVKRPAVFPSPSQIRLTPCARVILILGLPGFLRIKCRQQGSRKTVPHLTRHYMNLPGLYIVSAGSARRRLEHTADKLGSH